MIPAEQRDEWRADALAWGPNPDGLSEERLAASVLSLLAELDAAEGRARHLALSRMEEHTRAHKAERERDAARKWAERERATQAHWHAKWVAVLGDCICDGNPATTDGPEEDCPQHGRPYTEWVERGDALHAERQRLRDGIAALAERYDGYGHGPYGTHPDECPPCSVCALLANLRALLNPTERPTP